MHAAAAAAKSLQSCLTLCDPIDGSPPGPTVPGILQARTLEWVAISFSNVWKWKVKVKSFSCVWLSWPHGLRPTRLLLLQLLLSRFSCVQLCATPWTAAHQALLSMGFSRQEHWSGLLCLPPGAPQVYFCFISALWRSGLFCSRNHLSMFYQWMIFGSVLILCMFIALGEIYSDWPPIFSF